VDTTTDICGCIKLVFGTINGQEVGPGQHSVALPAGTSNIQGSITISVQHNGPDTRDPLVAVRSWEPPQTGFDTIHPSVPIGTNSYIFTFNEAIPVFSNGRGYLIFAAQ
jgi:hypothetical protein